MNRFLGKKILAPTDFSERCDDAARLAIEISGTSELVTVLHVAPDEAAFAAGDPAVVWETVSEEERKQNILESLRERFPDPKYQGLEMDVVFGRPAEEIVRYAEDGGFSLIVLPSHGRTGLARLVIGSVAEHVVRLAHCPVLALRD
jgi:nucleotide-binding universal stress UspA family protein